MQEKPSQIVVYLAIFPEGYYRRQSKVLTAKVDGQAALWHSLGWLDRQAPTDSVSNTNSQLAAVAAGLKRLP